jgi:hypothetical protein
MMPLATLALSLDTTRKSPPLGRLAELMLVSAMISVDAGVSFSSIHWRTSGGNSIRSSVLAASSPSTVIAIHFAEVSAGANFSAV